MFCEKCGQEIANDSIFCANCGNKVEQEIAKNPTEQETAVTNTAIINDQPATQEIRENKLLYIANKLGKFGLIFCWTFIAPMLLGEAGLILTIIGKCMQNKYNKGNELFKPALTKNIICFAIVFVLSFIIGLVIGILEVLLYGSGY